MGRYTQPQEVKVRSPTSEVPPEAITIGEALEAAARSVGDKAVEENDAAAIEAAEVGATSQGKIMAGGIAAAAQSAAARNALEEDKIKLSQILEVIFLAIGTNTDLWTVVYGYVIEFTVVSRTPRVSLQKTR